MWRSTLQNLMQPWRSERRDLDRPVGVCSARGILSRDTGRAHEQSEPLGMWLILNSMFSGRLLSKARGIWDLELGCFDRSGGAERRQRAR